MSIFSDPPPPPPPIFPGPLGKSGSKIAWADASFHLASAPRNEFVWAPSAVEEVGREFRGH